MRVLDQPHTARHTTTLEIRPRWSSPPPTPPDLRAMGVHLTEVSRVLRIEGPAHLEPQHLLALFDPIGEVIAVDTADRAGLGVDVFCRPGVTDAEGETAALALHYAGLPDARCRAGARYRFEGTAPVADRARVERALGNPLIHEFQWHGDAALPAETGASREGRVERIDLAALDAAGLLALSRSHSLALDLQEMEAVADHFRGIGRPATDVELQSIALAWSEHCSHKTFKAPIRFEHDGAVEEIESLFASCIAGPAGQLNRPWVRSAFVDNAGVVAFDAAHDLAIKVETHNHPSALEPFGGAHTGVGGVIRDVLAVSADPIANTDVLLFGPPDLPEAEVPAGALHPRATFRGVVRGIADYGNNMGIPTVGGAILFDPGYTANPLVYCGTLGIAPTGSHPRDPRPGDLVVLLGGRTGRDGLHGATMSSGALNRETVAGSTVQIGAPIVEKTVRDVLPHLRDERLYHAITDCGAGGLCSAVGEMAEELGVDVELSLVPLKYEGLAPWEIWLSEAQERMVLAVPADSLARVLALCCSFDVEATVIGRMRNDGRLHLTWQGEPVADLDLRFMQRGRPVRTLAARYCTPQTRSYIGSEPSDAADALLGLLAHPSIASKEEVIRRYDHEVQGRTVLKPLTGNGGPSDAAVLQPLSTSMRGAVLSHGINPLYGRLDPHAMAMLAVDEALRNLVAVGGSIDRAAALDNFCWGEVDDPDALGRLVRAAQGCRDASLAYGVPFVSGKDSLRNTSVVGDEVRSIPGTLLITCLGVLPDVRSTVTSDLKRAGSALFVLGLTRDELGGSHYLMQRGIEGGQVPRVRASESRALMRRLTRAIRRGLVLACHDLSEGGLAAAAAEMCLAGGLGASLDLGRLPAETEAAEALLFAESAGRFLVEVAEENVSAFEELMRGLPCAAAGSVTAETNLEVVHHGRRVMDVPVDALEQAWKGTIRWQ